MPRLADGTCFPVMELWSCQARVAVPGLACVSQASQVSRGHGAAPAPESSPGSRVPERSACFGPPGPQASLLRDGRWGWGRWRAPGRLVGLACGRAGGREAGAVAAGASPPGFLPKTRLLLESHEEKTSYVFPSRTPSFCPGRRLSWRACDPARLAASPFSFSEPTGSPLVGSAPSPAVAEGGRGRARLLTPGLLYPQVWSSCGARTGSC